jgi:hypothetical protein
MFVWAQGIINGREAVYSACRKIDIFPPVGGG